MYSLTVPNFILVFGDVMDELNGDDILSAVKSLSGVFAYTGAVAFVGGFFMVRYIIIGEIYKKLPKYVVSRLDWELEVGFSLLMTRRGG